MKLTSLAPFAFVCVAIGFATALLLVSGGALTVRADCLEDPGDNPPCCNGDVNADGSIDIADPVRLLAYLFAEGPEPAPMHFGLPATGQTLCYDTAGNVIDCDSEDWPGQDGFVQSGCPVEGRFVDNGDGTVTDNCTGLMWQQNTAPGTYDWQGALQYCENLELSEYDNWRLPNVRELQSIVDYGRFGPAIDPVFTATQIAFYWSSSSGPGSPHLDTDEAWHVFFGIGSVYGTSKSALHYVRAVRGGINP